MKERDIQTLFGNWLKKEAPGWVTTSVFELKLEKSKSMRFDRLAEHQAEALKTAKHGTPGLYHKITDQPIFNGQMTRFQKPKPFDCFYMKNVSAYVVIVFYVPRRPKEFLFIDIDRFLAAQAEAARLGRKSLKEPEYRLLAIRKEIIRSIKHEVENKTRERLELEGNRGGCF